MKDRIKYLENLTHTQELNKSAQGVLSGLVSGVSEYVKGLYDPERPVESVLAFIAPGVLFRFFPWLAVLYEVAEALGVDWKNVFTSIKDALKDLLDNAHTTKSNVELGKIENIVDSAFSQHQDGPVNKDKMDQLAQKYGNQYFNGFHKTAFGVKSKLIRVFVRTFSWLIKTVLISLGFAVGGGILSSVMPKDKENILGNKEEKSIDTSLPDKVKVKLNPAPINPLYLKQHPNNYRNIWVEKLSVDHIEDVLISWAIDMYPQLQSNKETFFDSPVFNKVVRMFKERNKGVEHLNVMAVPEPFERIVDIVNTFAADVAARIPGIN